MVDLSKPLSAEHCNEYHKQEYSLASNSYYTQANTIPGTWFGKQAEALGLAGAIEEQQFTRMAAGQDPHTGEQLVSASTGNGKRRAAWDMTIHAPKSISLTALVGNDQSVLRAHREAVYAALSNVAERYVQARGGGNNPPITTGRFASAVFHHDTARPVDGYPAPHMHSHCLIFNLTTDDTGKYRALQEHELYRIQSLIDAEYQSQLGQRVRALGYETQIGKNFCIDIKGYSKEYLDAESPRSRVIHDKLEDLGISGRHASSEIAHRERAPKLDLTPERLAEMHQEHASRYGNQPQRVVPEAARNRHQALDPDLSATKAVDFARDKQFERTAVAEHWELTRDAMRYNPGTHTAESIEHEIGRRIRTGELREVDHVRRDAPGARYTTLAMEHAEREILQRIVDRKDAVRPLTNSVDFANYAILQGNNKRQEIVRGILWTRDQIVAIQGTAGTGKTSILGIIAGEARHHGWRVEALAPTGKSADSLARSLASVGVPSSTIQSFNLRKDVSPAHTLYFLDEASLASTQHMQRFLARIGSNDHVLLIGDDSPFRKVGQHTSIEAGRVFSQMQEAGMRTAQLNKIFRQKDPGLKQVVIALRDADPERAIRLLDKQDRIREVSHRSRRYELIAKDYADSPYNTLIVSPDRKSVKEISQQVRHELRERGLLKQDTYTGTTLISKDLTQAEARRAAAYEAGDVIRYIRGNSRMEIRKRSYAEVLSADTQTNRLTVRTADGRTLAYDPDRTLRGASVYIPREQGFAPGDRIQFTAKHGAAKTRDSGYIEHIDETGNANILLDKGNRLRLNLSQCPHVDYGYAMTSHSSQSMTVDRVLIHAESDSKLSRLIDATFANVAGSRGQYDLKLYTDDKSQLRSMFSRSQNKHTALSREENLEYTRAMA